MSEEQKGDKSTNSEWHIADVIGWILFAEGVLNFISALVWISLQDQTDKWFMRHCISLICFGFAGIIFRLKK